MEQKYIERLAAALGARHITVYRLAQITAVPYELLRRVFRGERKLKADELIDILLKTGICFDEIVCGERKDKAAGE